MTLIQLATSMAGIDFSFEYGDYVECDASTAASMIDSQQATLADPDRVDPEQIKRFPAKPKPKPTKQKPTTKKPAASPKVDALKLEAKIAETLADGLAELPDESRPQTVADLQAYDNETGLEALTGIGKVAAGKIRAAIAVVIGG